MGTVYHYCSVETFLKIIQNKVIRLSDIGKSNDYAERSFIENLICEGVISRIEKEFPIEMQKFLLYTEEQCRLEMHQSRKLYAMCFSEEKDLLSQWRGYANNGKGLAIGFSKGILQGLNEQEYGLTFKKICYEEIQQKQFVEEQVQTIIDTLQKKNPFAAFAEVYENEIQNIGCMKSYGFKEEKEWRLCKALTPEVRVDCEARYKDFVLSKVQEKCVDDQIITYFDLSFLNAMDGFITEIIIGPSAKVTEQDIYTSLFINGFQSGDIEVLRSNITYR